MADKIQGKDSNGLRPATWPKLDMSAIEKIKVSDKASTGELANAIQQIISEAVIALYGNPKDKKYIKIVDLIMLRVRGALEEFDKQLSEKQESSNTAIVDSIKQSIEENFNKSTNQLKDTIESFFSKIQKIASSSEKEEKDEVDFSDESYYNNEGKSKKKSKNNSNSTMFFDEQESSESINNTAFQIESLLEKQTQSFDLLVQIQTEINDGFKKIETMISSINVQSMAKDALKSAQKPVNDVILNQQKKDEKQTNSQINKINEKITGENAGYDVNAQSKAEKKAIDQEEKKREKKEKKDEKNQLKNIRKKKYGIKNILTGKQFNILMGTLNTQFLIVTDYQELVIKKMNRQFNKINKKLDKLIENKLKHGFSWQRLLLFASLFLIPLFWNQIMDLIKYLDETFEIDKKIDEFVNKIDWTKHVAHIAAVIWHFIQTKFGKYVKDPINYIIEKTKKTYDTLVSWVKDVWKYVTGQVNYTKEMNKQQEKRAKKEERLIKQTIDEYRKISDQNIHRNIDRINDEANSRIRALDQQIDETASTINETAEQAKTTHDKIENAGASKMNNGIVEIEQDAQKFLVENQKKLEEKTKDAMKTGTNALEQYAKSVEEEIKENGSPTGLTYANYAELEKLMQGPSDETADQLAMKAVNQCEQVEDLLKFKKINIGNNENFLVGNYQALNQSVDSYSNSDAWGRNFGGSSNLAQKIRNGINTGEYRESVGSREASLAKIRQMSDKEKQRMLESNITEDKTRSLYTIEVSLFENTARALNVISAIDKELSEELKKSGDKLDSIDSNVKEYWSTFERFLKDKKENKSQSEQPKTAFLSISSGQNNMIYSANMKG